MKCTIRPPLDGGGSIKLWDFFVASGTNALVWVHGVMNNENYVDILNKNVKKSAASLALAHCWVFQQDPIT